MRCRVYCFFGHSVHAGIRNFECVCEKSGLYKREKVWYTESAVEHSSHIMRGCDGNKYAVRKTLQRAFGW